MFSIENIKLFNFKSYVGEHKFDFPTEPGLYFFTSWNEAEPRLERNGAGKSTLLDAIYWCFYGRDLRGLRGPEIITWGLKTAHVEIQVRINDQLHSITRAQSPNSLVLDGNNVEQDVVTKLLRLTPESFVYSVIMPQHNTSFFSLTPSIKLNILSQILNLDYWLDCSAAADDKAKLLAKECSGLEQTIQNIEASVEILEDDIKQLKVNEKGFIKQRAEEIKASELKLEELQSSFRENKADNKRFTDSVLSLTEERTESIAKLKRLEATKLEYLKQREEAATSGAGIQAKLEMLTEAVERLEGLDDVCPTCLQAVDAKQLKKETGQFKRERKELEDELSILEQKSVSAKKFIAKIWTDIADEEEIIRALDNDLSTYRSKVMATQTVMEQIKLRIGSVRADILSEDNKVNPFTIMVANKKAKLEEVEKNKTEAEANLASLEAAYEATHYWVQGFKRLRLYLVEETLRTYELEVNNCLASLGLEDWHVEFDVERENKSGGITKGFTVLIKGPKNPEPVKFEAWSGGEGQRLQLAGDFGLANLIMEQAGLANKIEFYDEPSKHLSGAGLLDLAETLHNRAINDGRVIILIDHHAIDFGDFAGVITVTKNHKTSTISTS